MNGENADRNEQPRNKLATSLTFLFVIISAVAWGCVAGVTFEPLLHLYGRGQGRISALLGLELIPLAMSALSIFLSLWLRNRNHATAALICPLASMVIWGIYFYVIARLMAV
jgi:uncharacterized membrane protein YuzA (DUF378 family)